MTTEIQEKYPYVMIDLCNGRSEKLVMKTTGAQYIYQVCAFDNELSYERALDSFDPADRRNMVKVPGQWAFLKMAGNLQYIPMERLNLDDVYADIMDCKRDAAQWVAEHWKY